MKKSAVSKRIAANIKAARKAAGLSQADIGRKLNLHYQQIQTAESGRIVPRVDTVLAYAKALNVPVASLLAGCE